MKKVTEVRFWKSKQFTKNGMVNGSLLDTIPIITGSSSKLQYNVTGFMWANGQYIRFYTIITQFTQGEGNFKER